MARAIFAPTFAGGSIGFAKWLFSTADQPKINQGRAP
jgi:hypothetical protein